MKTKIIHNKGEKDIKFKEGSLHALLHVPQDEKIPVSKMQAALRGSYGPAAKKKAEFYENVLKH